MPLVALKEQRYGGRTILAGETFEAASPRDVRTLIAIGRARQAEAKADEVEVEARSEPEKDTPKRQYKTRHMKAE